LPPPYPGPGGGGGPGITMRRGGKSGRAEVPKQPGVVTEGEEKKQFLLRPLKNRR